MERERCPHADGAVKAATIAGGASGVKPAAGMATALRVAGRSWRGAASEGLMPGAQGELQRNGKLFVLPIKAGRGRSRGRKSSAGAAGAQAVALEEATNRATACGRGVTRSTDIKGRPGVVDGAPAAEAGRPGAPGGSPS